MGLFGSKAAEGRLGIDVGASGLKVVELKEDKGSARLMTYGYTVDMPQGDGTTLIDDPKKAGKALAQVLKKSEAQAKRAVASLPIHAVYSTVIAIPEPKNQEEAVPIIEQQVEKLLPMPLQEMVLSSTFIDQVKKESVLKKEVAAKKKTEKKTKKKEEKKEDDVLKSKKQKNVRVLVTAAPRSLVNKYVEMFKVAGVTLDALDTESFGLIRSLIGKSKSTTLLVDVGASRTTLTVVENGVPFFSRSVQVGGFSITKQLATTLGISEEEAEQMKFDMGVGAQSDMMPAIIEKTFAQLVNEIRYVFEQYERQENSGSKRVEKIILTGGSAHIPGLTAFLTKHTNLNTYVGDPWDRVQVPEDLVGLLETIGPGFSVAIGLAMRDKKAV